MLSVLDKLIFGVGLLIFLQLPKFVDDYEQFLAGYYESTKTQVAAWKQIARSHEFATLEDMITRHLENAEPSVRDDATLMALRVQELNLLQQGIDIFKNDGIFHKLYWMLNPTRLEVIGKTLENFKAGLPLRVDSLAFGFVGAFLLSLLTVYPIKLLARKREKT
ncbi:DUF2937 family protein [uncultured Thiodictyon sp.]|uniref:DUF2937 family protein n=1 Tax=uncultured Thiodictyon sp. TaxID=1846217 RepID=UPI0025F603DE|nr:DUF2937 family protein [uncultured Thiodictyon sp.]